MSKLINTYSNLNEMLDADFNSTILKLKEPNMNLSLDNHVVNSAKDKLKNAQKNQKASVKAFEKNEKKFKVLKKYGEVLAKVERLLGLIPSELSNLSIDELSAKLEELLQTRKNNIFQLNLIFYQNMLSDLLTNLVNIEKDFQEGSISSAEALARVKEAKHDVKHHINDMPPVMYEPLTQASELVKLYENSYAGIQEATSKEQSSSLIKTEIKPEHELLFNTLTDKTKDLLTKVNNLSQDLSRFEPQVDLSKLTKDLKNTEDILELEHWDVDDMDSAVEKLNQTTTILTELQIEKNEEYATLSESIEEITTKSSELNSETIKEISKETFKQAVERAETTRETIKEVDDIPLENNMFATDIKKQFTETVLSQLAVDHENTDIVAINPEASVAYKDNSINEEVQQEAEELQLRVSQYELENGMMKALENNPEDEEDENDKSNRENPNN